MGFYHRLRHHAFTAYHLVIPAFSSSTATSPPFLRCPTSRPPPPGAALHALSHSHAELPKAGLQPTALPSRAQISHRGQWDGSNQIQTWLTKVLLLNVGCEPQQAVPGRREAAKGSSWENLGMCTDSTLLTKGKLSTWPSQVQQAVKGSCKWQLKRGAYGFLQIQTLVTKAVQ